MDRAGEPAGPLSVRGPRARRREVEVVFGARPGVAARLDGAGGARGVRAGSPGFRKELRDLGRLAWQLRGTDARHANSSLQRDEVQNREAHSIDFCEEAKREYSIALDEIEYVLLRDGNKLHRRGASKVLRR